MYPLFWLPVEGEIIGWPKVWLEYGRSKPYVTGPNRAGATLRANPCEILMAERTNPFTFLQQVRAEAAKVVWPSRRETAISTVMVLVMAVLASIFFLLADR